MYCSVCGQPEGALANVLLGNESVVSGRARAAPAGACRRR